ncbi:hypothetical protein ESCO_005625 [Escovopsis weberi]|uniref:Uncharacterized protein n=1 Tax=Escovopsis weberi TaxID=150374 RepID=A0A0M8N3R0_ESCWE|nr:hypothetical protein ESCO_005625 [Escovopsis weberi]
MSISTASPPSHRMQRQDSGYESLHSSSLRTSSRSSRSSIKRRPRASTATTATISSTTTRMTTTTTGSPVCFTTTISHRYSASQTCFSYTFPRIPPPGHTSTSTSPISSPSPSPSSSSSSSPHTPAHSTRASSPSSPPPGSWQSTPASSRQSVDHHHRAPLFPFAPIDLSRLRAGAGPYDEDKDEIDDGDHEEEEGRGRAAQQGPPATTHYWTSDSTRRLEYAEIDAASRGVAGWMRRRLRISLPACFTGREKHLAFDDDTGSVRRYRLALEEEE